VHAGNGSFGGCLKDFENVGEETLIQGLQSDACDPGFNTLLRKTLSVLLEENGEEGIVRVSVMLRYFNLLMLLYSTWFIHSGCECYMTLRVEDKFVVLRG
jgi:hypothetical protein